MSSENRIGQFLRARRALVRPTDVGLSDLGRRRVPGLRREELALLAGVSVDYYVRLEQGREQHPSEQVLDALARALGLDQDATAHLQELARPAARRRRATRRPRVGPRMQRLLDRWSETPAFVLSSRMDVLAHNALSAALHPGYTAWSQHPAQRVPGSRNRGLRRRLGEGCAQDSVGALRACVGPDLDDPQLNELVGELSLKSKLFRRLWARHDIHQKTGGVKRFNHPIVGELELDYETFAINAAPGQILTVYHAAPATRSEQALTLLATLAANAPATPANTERVSTSARSRTTPDDPRGAC